MSEHTTKKTTDLEERNFDLGRFIGRYIKYWYVFALSLIIALAIARYYNWYATPLYTSSCRLIIKDENANSSAENLLKDLSSVKRSANLDNEIQILKSKTLITKAVKQLEMAVTYELQGKIRKTELYTKSPFIIKTDTLNELAYFVDVDVLILNSQSFELAYAEKNKSEK